VLTTIRNSSDKGVCDSKLIIFVHLGLPILLLLPRFVKQTFCS